MIRVRNMVLAIAGLLAGCGAETPGTGSGTTPDPAPAEKAVEFDPRIQAELQDAVDAALTAADAPGMGVAIVTAEEGLIALAVAGVRVNGQPEPVQTDDLWHIGSCTKAVTAAVYAKRAEAGEAAWGAPLLALAPELAREADPSWRDVPVEAFLAHRTAIEDGQPGWFPELRLKSFTDAPVEDLRRASVSSALSAPQGESAGTYAYSNLGYMAVGAALEEGGEPWETQTAALLKEIGLGPDEFGFGPPQGDNPQGHVGPRGFPVGQGGPADNPAALGPAGTLHMSLSGWAKFVRLFLTDGGEVLSVESIDRLLSPWPEGEDYAMGWIVIEPGKRYQHGGSNTYWLAITEFDLEKGRAVLVTANNFSPETRDAVLQLVSVAMDLD